MPKSQRKPNFEEPNFKLFGIFGCPLSHTLSPRMQEAAFEKKGIKAFYTALEVTPGDFKKVCRDLNSTLLEGFNITVPYKQAVLPYLNRVTPEARAVGAVNTVYRQKGQWTGTNTDVYGFLTALKEEGRLNPKGKTALVFGAGGAARAVLYGLADSGAARIDIFNRHPERAKQLTREFQKRFPQTLFESIQDRKVLMQVIAHSDLVINATSLGLKAGDAEVIHGREIPAAGSRRTLFFDLIYHVKETLFLKAAKAKGYKVLNGLGMLLHQGAKAFELWTGEKAPVEAMRQALVAGLGDTKK